MMSDNFSYASKQGYATNTYVIAMESEICMTNKKKIARYIWDNEIQLHIHLWDSFNILYNRKWLAHLRFWQ